MKHLELKKIVLIGASTGGPGQIQKIIDSLPQLKNTSIIIAQHMVDGFLDSFSKRLQNSTKNSVSLVKNDQILKNSTIYICEGKTYLNIKASSLEFIYESAPLNSFNPDINTLFHSFVPLTKDIEILSVILTGIGDDGVEACSFLGKNGARCITENQSSAIVDGMPSRARLLVDGIEAYNINDIVKIISEFCE